MKYLPETGYPQSHEKVTAGTYICMQCDKGNSDKPTKIVLKKSDTLPECPNCGITYWMKAPSSMLHLV